MTHTTTTIQALRQVRALAVALRMRASVARMLVKLSCVVLLASGAGCYGEPFESSTDAISNDSFTGDEAGGDGSGGDGGGDSSGDGGSIEPSDDLSGTSDGSDDDDGDDDTDPPGTTGAETSGDSQTGDATGEGTGTDSTGDGDLADCLAAAAEKLETSESRCDEKHERVCERGECVEYARKQDCHTRSVCYTMHEPDQATLDTLALEEQWRFQNALCLSGAEAVAVHQMRECTSAEFDACMQ